MAVKSRGKRNVGAAEGSFAPPRYGDCRREGHDSSFPGEVLKNLTDSSLLFFRNGHAIAQQNGCIKER